MNRHVFESMRLLRPCLYTSLLLMAGNAFAQADSTSRDIQFQSEIPDHPLKSSNASQKRSYRYGDKPANVNTGICGYALRGELVAFVNWKISSDSHSGKYRIKRVSKNSVSWDSIDHNLIKSLDTLFARADIQYLQDQVECYLQQEFLWRRRDLKQVQAVKPRPCSEIKRGEEYWSYSVPLFLADQAYVILKYAYEDGGRCDLHRISLFRRTKNSWTEVKELQRMEVSDD